MDLMIGILSAAFKFIAAFLIVLNIASVVGYALHKRKLVDNVQRRLVRVTALLRLGIR
ncbi:hypothetical protein [Sphingobium sp. CCH11-B1]|uniref:hypothetical protein n=1 Tax=Sphingobium sp. CCH11-B1 TaxID=1768781 RepID=UPI000AD6BBEA|nr:hypothetical protein [Sphingobium sp. CCH11-B1]